MLWVAIQEANIRYSCGYSKSFAQQVVMDGTPHNYHLQKQVKNSRKLHFILETEISIFSTVIQH